MGPILSLTPWGLQEGLFQLLSFDVKLQQHTVSGACCPRVIVPVDLIPKYGGKSKPLPRVSFPFRWDGNVFSAFQLPTDPKPNIGLHDLTTKIVIQDTHHKVVQTDIVGRPSKKYENELGKSIEGFINWQIHCFRELSDNGFSLDGIEEKTESIIRLDWSSVRKAWMGNKQDEAVMALIVKLAQDSRLMRLFETIAKNPRHVLLRERKNTNLGRIQELDSACIRDFARRPGRTIYEKAGSRQELLSVQRVESRDTLENRVFVWVLKRMMERSWSYKSVNNHHDESSRVKLVTRLNKRCTDWQRDGKLKDLSGDQLNHPVQPNYTLQMDDRYSKVHKTYKELLKEQHVIDDSWEWQRNLWSESARQLMFCAMTEFNNECYTSTPYYRIESENGIWTEMPVSPGPFKTGSGLCHVIDSRDVNADLKSWIDHPPFDFAMHIGSTGGDQVLYWPESKTLVVVWFVYSTGSSSLISSMLKGVGVSLKNLSSDLQRYTITSYRCYGLMLITEDQGNTNKPGVEVETWPSTGELSAVALKIPFNIERASSVEFESLIEDFKTGIQIAVEMAC
jgi:hypothetical protein